MQMHSASETKAVFVGSQRPPPQSPSSFLWIGTLTFPTVMRPWITLSLLPPSLPPSHSQSLISLSLPVFPLRLSLPPITPGEQHSGWTSTVYVLQSEPMRIYGCVCHRRSNLLQENSARCTLGITTYPWVGLQTAPT